jgi:hypothetical protein
MRVVRILCAAAALSLAACAGLRPVGAEEELAIRTAAARLAADIPGIGSVERGIVEDGVYWSFDAMARRDPSFVREALPQLRTAEDIQRYTLRRFSMTTPEFALEVSMALDRQTPFDYGSPVRQMSALRTDHFTLRYYPGTRAAADLDRISFLAERTLEEILRLMAPTAAARERFSANLGRVNDGTISLILPPNSRYWKRFNATAQMTFGCGWDAGRGTHLDMTIGVPYFNTLGCATLAHEITHMVDLLCKLEPGDLEAPDGITAENAESVLGTLMKTAMERIWPHDTPFGEGMAMYASTRIDPFHRYLLLPASAVLKAASARRPVRHGILLRSPVSPDRRTRILQYEELLGLVEHIVARNGIERFMEFYLTPPLTEERFTERYGIGYADMEAEWRVVEGL